MHTAYMLCMLWYLFLFHVTKIIKKSTKITRVILENKAACLLSWYGVLPGYVAIGCQWNVNNFGFSLLEQLLTSTFLVEITQEFSQCVIWPYATNAIGWKV